MVDLATAGETSAAVKVTTATAFSADVLVESQKHPVLVHFMSPRSEACKTLQEALQRAAKATDGKVKLVSMDIDAHPQIASRLGIRQVPAVYAFQNGQPVDGFMGALPEPQLRAFLERLVGPLEDDFAQAMAEADAALAGGDAQTAGAIYAAINEQDPENAAAAGGLARVLVAGGNLEGARELLDGLAPTARKDKAVVAAQAALDAADQASGVGDLTELAAKVQADPADHQSRFDLALGLNGQNKREEAANALLASIQIDRTWNDGAARRQLLQFFEAWGLMDPMTLAARRKLSTLLFS